MKKYKLLILVCSVAVTLCSCSSESSNIYTQYDDQVSNVISTVRSLDNPYFEDYIFTQLESPYYTNEKIFYPVIYNSDNSNSQNNTSTQNNQNSQNTNTQSTQNTNTGNVNPYYNNTYQNQNYTNSNGYNTNGYNSNVYPNMNNVMYGGLYNPNYMNGYGNGNGYGNNTNNYGNYNNGNNGNYNNGGYVGYNNWGNGYNNGFVNNTSLLGGTFLGNAVIPNIDTYSYRGQSTTSTVTASSSNVSTLNNSSTNNTNIENKKQSDVQKQTQLFNYVNQYRNYSPKYVNTNNYVTDYKLNTFITNIQDLYYITNDLTAANSIVSSQVNSVVSTTMKIRKYLYILNSTNHSMSDSSIASLSSNFDALSTILDSLKSSIGSVSSELVGIATLKQNFTTNAEQLNSKYLKIINVLDCRIIQLNNLQTALGNIKSILVNEYGGDNVNIYGYIAKNETNSNTIDSNIQNTNLIDDAAGEEKEDNKNTQLDSVIENEQNLETENSVLDNSNSNPNTEEKLNMIKQKIIEQEHNESNNYQLNTESETKIIDNTDIIDETMSEIKSEQNILQDDCSETKNIIDEIADNIDSNMI